MTATAASPGPVRPGASSAWLRSGRLGVLVLAGAVLLAACGAARTQNRSISSTITSEEIRESSGLTAHEIVQQLRPQFLRVRGSRSISGSQVSEPVVYVDNIRMGGLSSLREIRASAIEEIRYIGAADATTRWGTGHMGGAILVILRT
jgi:hypothetical protein